MTDEDRAAFLWHALNECLRKDRSLTLRTITHWLEFHGAGMPQVALMQERVRDDAQLWAMSAQQIELETYTAAAVVVLENSPLPERAAKRIAAWAYKTMSEQSREAFREWMDKK